MFSNTRSNDDNGGLQDGGPIRVSRRRLVDGAAAGLVATLVMTALVLAAPALGGRVPEVAERLLAALRAHPLVALVALAVHLAYGSFAGALFVAGSMRISLGRGLAFGVGLWGLAATVYAPLCGLGFLAWSAPGLAAMTIPAHLLYGAALGALAPRGEILQPLEESSFDDEFEPA